jgi:hypothetical protein
MLHVSTGLAPPPHWCTGKLEVVQAIGIVCAYTHNTTEKTHAINQSNHEYVYSLVEIRGP